MEERTGPGWKSVAIGCVVVLALAIAVIGYGIYKFAELPRLHFRAVANNSRYPFTPTPDSFVGADRLDAWIAVQRKILPFQTLFNFDKTFDEGAALKNISDMLAAGADGDSALKMHLPGVVDALETGHMSTQEYRWIFGQTVAALNSPAAANDPAFAELLEKWPRRKLPADLASLGQANKYGRFGNGAMLRLLKDRLPVMLETIGVLDLPALDMIEGLKEDFLGDGPGLLSFPPRHLEE